jgi:hypothetical protein
VEYSLLLLGSQSVINVEVDISVSTSPSLSHRRSSFDIIRIFQPKPPTFARFGFECFLGKCFRIGERKNRRFSDIAAWGSSRRSTDGGEGRGSIIDAAATRSDDVLAHHDDNEMDDYDNSGASNAAIRLFDWVGDMEMFTRMVPKPRQILFRKCCPYSPKRAVSSKKKRVKKNLTRPIS